MTDENDMTPPVKVGEVIEDQEVINLGKHNDGVIKYQNYIIFVSGDMKIGDIVTLTIEKVLPKFGIGTKIKEGEQEWMEILLY